jgi:hypothetical protein
VYAHHRQEIHDQDSRGRELCRMAATQAAMGQGCKSHYIAAPGTYQLYVMQVNQVAHVAVFDLVKHLNI